MNSRIRIRESEKCEAFLRRWLWACEIVMLLTIFTMYAVRNNPSVNFSPMNGTYQNYNPVRRLLNGQIPMRDFQDYLGMGHLYLGTFMTALFGGDYHASLYAFDFLTMLSTLLIFWAIGYSVLRDKTLTTTTTCLAFLLVITGCLSICEKVPLIGRMIGVLSKGLDAGNSARIIRGMILPIVLALLLLSDRFLPTVVKKAKIPDGFNRWLPAIVTGLIAGFAFVWSNDYGISCWVCLTIIMGWTSLSRFRRLGPAILDVLVELVASLVSLLVVVWLATQGNVALWLQSIVGAGGYQRWYYNSDKAYYLFDLEYSMWILLQAAVCIAYMVALFRNRGSREAVIRYGVPALANMVCYCAVNEYRLLSGNEMFEVANIVLFATVLFEGMHLLPGKKRVCGVLTAISIGVGLIWIGSSVVKEVPSVDGVYVEKLGGCLTYLGEDIIEAGEFLNGEEVWATYASAQEALQDTFQPSGTDYIIHVMGDRQREEYLNKFKTGDFRYTATIRKSYAKWEYWVERANWFFYQELYENWHPVFANEYELYWERNSAGEDNVVTTDADVQIERLDKATAVLSVHTDESVNGIADVWIDYEVFKDEDSDWRRRVMLEPMLHVENTGYVTAEDGWFYESNNLRSVGSEFIPIPIQNGYGEVTLSGLPFDNVGLEIRDAKCERVFADLTADYRVVEDENDN